MANASIPGLPVAISLDGTEQMELVQPAGSGGTTKRATTGQIAALAGTGGSPAVGSFILATANAGLANSRVLAVATSDIVYTDTGALGTATIGPINTAAISYAKFQQVGGLSVLGVSSNATGIIDAMAGSTNQVFRVAPNGTALGFGQLNLSSTSAVTGFLATSYITGSFSTGSFTGVWPVSFGGTGTSTLTANGVLVGNGTGSVAIATSNTAGYVLTDNGTAAVPTFQPPGGLAQQPGLSVLGVTGSATATPSGIVGTRDQVVRVSNNGTALTFGAVNIATSAAVTGTLAVSNGGLGVATMTAFALMFGNGTAAVSATGPGSAGQLIVGQTTTSAPLFKTVAGDLTMNLNGSATIAAGAVTFSKFQTMTGLSVMGVTGTATAAASTITGTTNQVLVVNPGGTGVVFGQVNLSSTSSITGTLNATAYLTGVVSVALGGTGATTLSANGVLVGNGTSSVQVAAAATSGFVLTSNGTSSAPSFQASGASLSQASQAQMEAATATTVYVSPGNLNWGPGVTKAFAEWGVNSTALASLNVSSITDVGTGAWTVNYTIPFSSTSYVVTTGFVPTSGAGRLLFNISTAAIATGSTGFISYAADAVGALAEGAGDIHMIAVKGDQ